MTTPTQSNAQQMIETIVASEPRLQAIGNDRIRKSIAAQMFAGASFEEAEEFVIGLIQGADTLKVEIKERVEKQQTETEAQFAPVSTLLMELANKLDGKLPQGGIVFTLNAKSALKNPDGSPQMDAENNPVYGYTVEPDFRWVGKKAKGTARAAGTTDGRGRPEGKYLIDGETYSSMAKFANEKFPDFDGNTPSRKFLEDKGYVIPTEPVTNDKGEKIFAVTSPAQLPPAK